MLRAQARGRKISHPCASAWSRPRCDRLGRGGQRRLREPPVEALSVLEPVSPHIHLERGGQGVAREAGEATV